MELEPSRIRPSLYLSSFHVEAHRDVLESHGITHILQVGAELEPTHSSHFKYLQLAVTDLPEQDIIKIFPAAFNFIDDAIGGGGAVLVHCQAGVSRSATVVIGYCMWKDKLSVDAAVARVMEARRVVWPNPGFKCQLRQFERLDWDATKWSGWSSEKYLSLQYGDENVGFMSHMLGGTACDSLIGSGVRMDPTRVLHRAHMATAGPPVTCGNSTQGLYGVAAGKQRRSSWSYSFSVTAELFSGDSSPRADHRVARGSTDSDSSGCGSRRSSKSSLSCRQNSFSYSALASCKDPDVAAAGAAMATVGASVAAFAPMGRQASLVDREAALMMAG